MIPRIVESEIERGLDRQAAVALIGPRQVGKTTLAFEIARKHNGFYLDLESIDDRHRLTQPVLFFDSMEDRLVVLDEIHRMPELFQVLRGVIDKRRRKKKELGRFLILGSASIDLLNRSGETLAGRIAYVDLSTLSILEIENTQVERERLWLRGGFPDSYLAKNDKDSFALRKDFIRTYLERDVALFGPRIPSTTLERLWMMLAHHQGQILNASRLAKALEVSTQSVNRYIDLLSDLLLIRRLPSYRANVKKRLVKSPKVYIRDSGLVHALLGLQTFEQLSGHPIIGFSWEGFVLEILLSVLPYPASAFFYRTAAGAEIDMVIDRGSGNLWAIEIKRSLSGHVERGFYQACADLDPERAFVVYAGEDSYPVSDNVQAISIYEMAKLIQKL